jgi:hypothetical protein
MPEPPLKLKPGTRLVREWNGTIYTVLVTVDPHLISLVHRGWAAWKKLTTEQRSANPVERSHLVRLARLRFLAPDITMAIIEGRQPVELTARKLLRSGELPIDWNEQRKALGFT